MPLAQRRAPGSRSRPGSSLPRLDLEQRLRPRQAHARAEPAVELDDRQPVEHLPRPLRRTARAARRAAAGPPAARGRRRAGARRRGRRAARAACVMAASSAGWAPAARILSRAAATESHGEALPQPPVGAHAHRRDAGTGSSSAIQLVFACACVASRRARGGVMELADRRWSCDRAGVRPDGSTTLQRMATSIAHPGCAGRQSAVLSTMRRSTWSGRSCRSRWSARALRRHAAQGVFRDDLAAARRLVALIATYLAYRITARADDGTDEAGLQGRPDRVGLDGRAGPRHQRRAEDDGHHHPDPDHRGRARPRTPGRRSG